MMALSGVDRAHVGGLRDLLARYSVGRALDPGAVYPAADYVRWRAALRAGGVAESKLRAGARYTLDRDAHLEALLPRGLDPDAPDTPVALRLVFGRLSALLLNRAALAYPGLAPALQAGGIRHDTVLVLSGAAGVADPRGCGERGRDDAPVGGCQRQQAKGRDGRGRQGGRGAPEQVADEHAGGRRLVTA